MFRIRNPRATRRKGVPARDSFRKIQNMDQSSRSAPESTALETPPPEPTGSTSLMALLAISPPAPIAREVGARLGGQVLDGISSQGGMELAVFAFASTAAALKCSRELLEAPGGENCALGLHLGEVSLEAGGSAKSNTDRESVRIATGLSQQAEEGSALLSQTFYEIARAETDTPANYLGPKQIRLVPRTVPVFKLNLGNERANQKNLVTKQMDLLLREERQRNQEARERSRRQARIIGVGLLVAGFAGFGLFLARLAARGKLDSLVTVVEVGLSGDAGKAAELGAPSSDRPPGWDAPPPSPSSTAQGYEKLLNGEALQPEEAKAAYCLGLYQLAKSVANLESPSAQLAKSLDTTRRSAAERRIISDHYLAELNKANDIGLFQDANLERLGHGLPPDGYKVVQLLPSDRYPQFTQFPANFILRRASYSSPGGTVEAVELLDKLRAAGLVKTAP